MSRKYTHIKEYSKTIEALHKQGKTHREVAEKLGMDQLQIKKYFARKHAAERKKAAGILPQHKGRPSKEYVVTEKDKDQIIAQQKYIINRKDYQIHSLERRIEMLEDFAELIGKK